MGKTIAIKLLTLLVFFLHCVLFTHAQTRTVTGTVIGADGKGIPGVTVSVKGTNTATQTAEDGTYTITAADNATLVLSSVGYGTSEIQVNGRTSITSSLATENANLSEVVVVGYGTARRRDVTGSTASVREKDFNKGVFTSPDQLIQGKAAGVLVINNTGQPGGSTTVRIRGASSIRSGNQPLFVIDGVPLSGGAARPGGNGASYGSDGGNPLNFINPNDIASIEILKDASATAIYGSRGANGVVIITTKRGQSGVPQVDLNASVSASNIAKRLEVLNGNEYRQALKDYGATSGDYGGNVDALDEILRTGITQNYNIAVGGGAENGRYRISAGYLDQQGIVKTSELKKLTANLVSNFRFLESKKLGLDINVLVTQTNERIAPVSAFVGFTGNLISQALQWNPTLKLRTDSGFTRDPGGASTINPLAQLEYFDDQAKINSIIASISPSYRITKELEYRFLYSVNRQVGIRRGQVDRRLNAENIENRGQAFIGNQEQTNRQLTNTLNFNKQVTSGFNLNAVIGHEWLTFDTRGNGLSGQDFPNVGLNYYDL
ncbi:MAG TPA: SusC/RagA family TonB-linked outer membrane protein, partial [Flavisolibacter sp.]|nr:SusC/RagA family TonB-linked outer membrane protein [Flavisolibacter sp.]